MSKLIILFISAFVISAIDGSTPAPMKCKKNEVYLGQGKAPNCDTVCSELDELCKKMYIQAPFGCYCVKGYARDSNNVCIPIRKCPPKDPAAAIDGLTTRAPIKCKKNEVYLEQGKAPNCDTVCSELGERCTKMYIQAPFGCYCVKGYARDSNNVCIPICKCPPKDPVAGKSF